MNSPRTCPPDYDRLCNLDEESKEDIIHSCVSPNNKNGRKRLDLSNPKIFTEKKDNMEQVP